MKEDEHETALEQIAQELRKRNYMSRQDADQIMRLENMFDELDNLTPRSEEAIELRHQLDILKDQVEPVRARVLRGLSFVIARSLP